MDDANVQRGLQKALSESSSKSAKAKTNAELAPTDSDASTRSGSPDQCCPICLGKFKDKSFSDGCFHRFCFQCIREWAKVKSTCPLCKTPFKSIIHNVVSSDVYDQYVLQPSENGSFDLDHNGTRFRYHTTLTTNRRSAWETRMDQLFNRRARLAERIHRENEARQRRQLIFAAGLRVHHIAANRFTRFRDTSPAFFRENPAVTHRLIPWLERDLGVLFNGNEQHVRFMTQYIISLLPNVDIQSEEFHNHLRPFLYGRTEHFIHEFTSFARSPHNMDTYDQMAQYDFRPENPQFTATLRPQQPLVAQESSTSEESDNAHSNNNNNEVIVISDDDDDDDSGGNDSNPTAIVVQVKKPHSGTATRNDAGPSSTSDVAGPSTSFDLSTTHNPEPPVAPDPDQPGPSGIQIKQEQDSGHTANKAGRSDDSSGSVEIVGYQKPFHLRTPIAFITISTGSSGEDKHEATTSSKLRRSKHPASTRNGAGEEKAGGKRKQKTKHTRKSHSTNRAERWSSESEDSYYRSRRDKNYDNREEEDDRDGSHSSRYYSRNRSSYHRSPRSPTELYRKVREERNKWILYYETRHAYESRSRSRSSPRSRARRSRSCSRSPSRSKSSYSRRRDDDHRYNDYERSRDYASEKRQSRDHYERRRSRSQELLKERVQSAREENGRRRSRSRSPGRSFDPFSDESKVSSRYSSRYASTSSTLSRLSANQDRMQKRQGKDESRQSSPTTSRPISVNSKSSECKRKRDSEPEKLRGEGEGEGNGHHGKKHKHKHKHHKKRSSKHKHRSHDKGKDSKHKSKGKSSSKHASKDQKTSGTLLGEALDSLSDSTVTNLDKDAPNIVASHLATRGIVHIRNSEPHVTLQDLLNMDEDLPFDSPNSIKLTEKGVNANIP